MNSEGIFLLLSTLTLVAGLIITYWIHSRVSLDIVVSPAERPAGPLPLISVIVPARNEARNIRRCVQALLAQDYPRFELIVVEDRSTDDTPRILAELSTFQSQRGPAPFQVLAGSELPTGWAGKPHALTQGAAAAQGEWLCFIDADTFAGPHLLSAALASAQVHQAGLLTLLTSQELGTFWEKVILPVVFTALSFGFPARRVNDPTKPDAIANGQFILISRSVYEAVGGHAAVPGAIAEDKILAQRVKKAGFRLVVADGRALVQTRMYTSLPEIWEGWTKNIFLGMQDRLGLLLLGALTGLVGALLLPAWLLAALAWVSAGGGMAAWLVLAEAALLWLYLLGWRALAAQAFGIPLGYALTLPLGALVFTAMMFASAYNVLSGRGVSWKGRTYKLPK
jgi:chlorobactene glucosyltransferase